MLLAVAVENTRTLVGVLDQGEVRRHWWVGTDPRRTADEWGVLLGGLLGTTVIDGVAVCSAVPSVLHELREVVARYYPDVPGLVVEPGVKTGLPVLVDNPREVGTDRIANALAAVKLYGGPCVVVDFGTATTFEVVNESGAYIGGAIAPGIETSLDALGRTAAQLRRVELILLDNMAVPLLREAVEKVAGRAKLEASGGLTLEVAREVAETGVDYLAVGALTHSAPVLDIALDLQEA